MSKKCDLTIQRDMTISVGNFSMIKPGVTVTLKDIDSDNMLHEYDRLSNLVDALIALEILKTGEEMKSIMDSGFNTYLKEISKHQENMINEICKFSTKGIIDG